MNRVSHIRCLARGGFTLVELLVASAITVTVFAVSLTVYVNAFRSWTGINMRMDADREVNLAMSRMVYGVGDRLGIRSAANVAVISLADGWRVNYQTGSTYSQTNSFTYSKTARNLVFNPGAVIAGKDLSFAQVFLLDRSLVVSMRVERVEGTLKVLRELGTEISWRN